MPTRQGAYFLLYADITLTLVFSHHQVFAAIIKRKFMGTCIFYSLHL